MSRYLYDSNEFAEVQQHDNSLYIESIFNTKCVVPYIENRFECIHYIYFIVL